MSDKFWDFYYIIQNIFTNVKIIDSKQQKYNIIISMTYNPNFQLIVLVIINHDWQHY